MNTKKKTSIPIRLIKQLNFDYLAKYGSNIQRFDTAVGHIKNKHQMNCYLLSITNLLMNMIDVAIAITEYY